MPRKRIGVSKSKRVALPILNPDAAGIDIGATEIYVAVAAAVIASALSLRKK
jgi:hypothetical protein